MERRICRRSKRGVSLVEEICAVLILVIGVITVVSAIGLSRTSVLSDNTQEGASARVQEISDSLIALLSKNSTLPDVNTLQTSTGAADKGASENNFSYSADKPRQFICIPDTDPNGIIGYKIITRVYYNNGKNYVQMTAYSNATADSYSPADSAPPAPIIYTPPIDSVGVPYLLYGTQYGTNQVAVNPNTPAFVEGNKKSSYPVVFDLPVQNPSGQQTRTLAAPSVFFMGGSTGTQLYKNCSVYSCSAAQATIQSNFIYVASKMIAFQKNPTDANDNPQLLVTPLDLSKPAYLYFASSCQIIQTDNISNELNNSNNHLVRTINPGLYQFTGLQNLFQQSCTLTPVTDLTAKNNALNTYNASYIENSIKNQTLVSGETSGNAPTAPYNGAAGWTKNGALQSGTPSGQTGKDVYVYANDVADWGSAAQTYQANLIAMQCVDSSGMLTVPAGKSVTFDADTVSLNGQKTDDFGSATDEFSIMQGGTDSRFIIQASKIVVFHTLNVKDASGKTLYTLKPGTYQKSSGSYDLNLFSVSDAAGAFGSN